MSSAVPVRTEKSAEERLDSLGHAAAFQLDASVRLAREAAQAVWRAGKSLTEAKALCGHGTWMDFLKKHGIPPATASQAMKLYKNCQDHEALAGMGITEAKETFKVVLKRSEDSKLKKRALEEARQKDGHRPYRNDLLDAPVKGTVYRPVIRVNKNEVGVYLAVNKLVKDDQLYVNQVVTPDEEVAVLPKAACHFTKEAAVAEAVEMLQEEKTKLQAKVDAIDAKVRALAERFKLEAGQPALPPPVPHLLTSTSAPEFEFKEIVPNNPKGMKPVGFVYSCHERRNTIIVTKEPFYGKKRRKEGEKFVKMYVLQCRASAGMIWEAHADDYADSVEAALQMFVKGTLEYIELKRQSIPRMEAQVRAVVDRLRSMNVEE